MSSDILHVHIVKTDASDKYLVVSHSKKERDKLIKAVWEAEGRCESLRFYKETTSVCSYEIPVASIDSASTLTLNGPF